MLPAGGCGTVSKDSSAAAEGRPAAVSSEDLRPAALSSPEAPPTDPALSPAETSVPAASSEPAASAPSALTPEQEETVLTAVRAALSKQIQFDLTDTLFLDRVGGYYACIMLTPEEEDIRLIMKRFRAENELLCGYEISYSRIDMGNVWQVWYIVRAELTPGQDPFCTVSRYYTEAEYRAAAGE